MPLLGEKAHRPLAAFLSSLAAMLYDYFGFPDEVRRLRETWGGGGGFPSSLTPVPYPNP